MENADKFGFFAKDVATDLEIPTSTLRRWSLKLEELGYSFERNEKDQPIYYELQRPAPRGKKESTCS